MKITSAAAWSKSNNEVAEVISLKEVVEFACTLAFRLVASYCPEAVPTGTLATAAVPDVICRTPVLTQISNIQQFVYKTIAEEVYRLTGKQLHNQSWVPAPTTESQQASST